jgi:pyruvyltransferase
MVGHQVSTTFSRHFGESYRRNKLLAVGSIIHMAEEGDCIWGAGVNGKHPNRKDQEFYRFANLDVKAVRGPLTKEFLNSMGIDAPEVYGDPALLLPRLFPEFKKAIKPSREYVLIPHIDDEHLFSEDPCMISCKEDWKEIILAILDSKFVISTALHGIIVAEAFGIPTRYLKVSDGEPLFKYMDYYYGTGRANFQYAKTVKEALKMRGEPPVQFDEEALLNSFPYEQFPSAEKPASSI